MLSMHRLHFKYDYQAAILENQLRAITWLDQLPSFNHRYIYIVWGYFTVSSQEVSTLTLAISLEILWCETIGPREANSFQLSLSTLATTTCLQ
jgi:hypothetical protein